MAPFTVTPWMPDVPAVCPALFRLRWSAWPIAIACAPALLQAQTLPAPSAEDTRLPDITVTATRQPERVQDVAAAVGVVKGADARVAGPGMQLSESLVSVPGVAALNRQNMAQDLQISSRAFGARSTFGVRGVRLYEDGIPLTMPDGQGQSSSFDLSQAQRIEVLRGPASALYGNASGGVISLFTADGGPTPEVSFGRTMSRDGTQKTTASASGQTGALNYVIDANQASTDGYRAHSRAVREQWRIKMSTDWTPDTRVTLIASHVAMPEVQDPLGLTWDQWKANPSQAGTNAIAYNTRKEIQQGQIGAVLSHRLSNQDNLTATTYTGQRSATQWQSLLYTTQSGAAHPGGVIDLGRQFGGMDLRHAHQGQLASLPWQMTWGVSLDTLREDRRGYRNYDSAGNLGVTGDLRRNELNRATSRDLYILQQLTLTPDWQASLGVRRSRVLFTSRDQYIVTGNGDDSGRMDFEATTPTASLMRRLSPNWQTYVSLGRSFETPTLNEVAYRSNSGTVTGWNTSLQAATATHREWGTKYSCMDESARSSCQVDLAIFDVSTNNEIAVQTNSGGRATYQNVGHTHRQGLELSHVWRPLPAWQWKAAATWTRANYEDPFSSTSAGSTQVVQAGQSLPGVPRRILYGELQWQPQGPQWHVAASWRHVGRIWANDVNDAWAPASGQWGMRAVWRTMLADWRVDTLARVDNVFNQHAIGSVIVNESQRRYFEPSPGRSATLGVNFTKAFD